jgi:hypothetical protein
MVLAEVAFGRLELILRGGRVVVLRQGGVAAGLVLVGHADLLSVPTPNATGS